MTDNDKAIVEWLREMADEYDHGHHESWPTIDAFNQAADRIEAQAAEIERLREAGGDLGFYAGHDDSCDCVKGWAKGPCNCGYMEAWKAWRVALGETE